MQEKKRYGRPSGRPGQEAVEKSSEDTDSPTRKWEVSQWTKDEEEDGIRSRGLTSAVSRLFLF